MLKKYVPNERTDEWLIYDYSLGQWFSAKRFCPSPLTAPSPPNVWQYLETYFLFITAVGRR